MLISREKRRTNIAEYILYMWQVEDTIRAFGFDIDKLDNMLISQYEQPDEVRKEIREWYENIAAHMKKDSAEQSGHAQFLKNIVSDLHGYHLFLLQQPGERKYSEMFAALLPLIREMNAKQKWSSENEIETCLNAVYIFMMMRLRKNSVSAQTEQAINLFIQFLALLSSKFREAEESR
jgi:flagellin-specific chaperone FliS